MLYTFHLETLNGTELDTYSYVVANNRQDAIRKIRSKCPTELIEGLHECRYSSEELDIFERTRLIK